MVVGCQPYAPAAFTSRKYSWHSFLLEPEDFTSMKNPLTPAGIELATFRFVAQHLNHCATAFPQLYLVQSTKTQRCPETGDPEQQVARHEGGNSTQGHRTENLVTLLYRMKYKYEKMGNLRKNLILGLFGEIVVVVENSKYFIF